MRTLTAFLAIVTLGGGSQEAPITQESVRFCRSEVADVLVRGNASFHLIYELALADDGHVRSVRAVLEKDGVAPITDCLATWRLEPERWGTPLRVALTWEHAKAWTTLRIAGPRNVQVIRLSGPGSPYGRQRHAQAEPD